MTCHTIHSDISSCHYYFSYSAILSRSSEIPEHSHRVVFTNFNQDRAHQRGEDGYKTCGAYHSHALMDCRAQIVK